MDWRKENIFILLGLLMLVFVALLSGCRNGGQAYSAELTAIDSLLAVDPDSAWQRISDYDSALLRTAGDRHYHSLLLAEASDKTYNGVPNDSALSDAAEYFLGKDDVRKAMRSMFYRGLAYHEAGEYGHAIITLFKSIELADTSEHLYRGKIYNAIRETYKSVSDAPQELEYARRALEEYQKLDSLVFIEDMKLAYGYALCWNNKFEEGIHQMREVYEAAKTRNDEETRDAALIHMVLGYLWVDNNASAKDCLTILYTRENNIVSFSEYLFFYLNSINTSLKFNLHRLK